MATGFVRPARPGDAEAIARIQLVTWRTAYRRLLPKRVLGGLDEAWMATQWRDAIVAPPSDRHRVLIAIEQAAPPIHAEQAAPPIHTEHAPPPASGDQAASPADDEQAGPPTDAEQALPPADAEQTAAPADADARSHLVGFIAAGPADEAAEAPDEKPLPDTVAAITDLLVEPRWGRRGHGSRLLAAAVDGWREDGFETAVAWAYDDDPATRRFLASAGWEPDGASRALDVDDLLVRQLRLHVAIDVEPS
jgi:GNAT superfamily N-acetyltransferase